MPRRLPPLSPLAVLLAVLTGAGAVAAQDPAEFTQAQLDSLVVAAELAPLFDTHEPLEMTLSTRIQYLRDERPDDEDIEGLATWTLRDGGRRSVDVEVRTRGNFRRAKRNCNFPPLRLDFPRSRVSGTVWEGQNRLKLVVPCHDGREHFQRYVLREYMAYRVYNLVTPVSHRVRLVRITFLDVDLRYDTRTKLGFLIEDLDQLAHRNRAFPAEFEQWHPRGVDGRHASLMALYQYMIGNTDYSQVFFHNTEMIRSWDGRYLPIPYDLDVSGVVDANYATPDPSLNIRSVRQRVYRGFCYEGVDHEALRQHFLALRPRVEEMYREFGLMEEDDRKDALAYYRDFWERLEEPGALGRMVRDSCIPLPG